MSIQTGNQPEQRPATTGGNNYAPKTGLFKAIVAAINPNSAEIDKMLGKQLGWNVEYTGKTKEGDDKINMDIWLQEVTSGDHFRLKFMIVNKERESKNTPGLFQWVNNAGMMLYAKSEEDIASREGTMFENFRSRPFRKALVGEENLFDFLTQWIMQGKKIEDPTITIDPNISRMFEGNFTELQEEVKNRIQRQDRSVITALGTISHKDTKTYQNVWKKVAPGWWYEKILAGDNTGFIGKWTEEVTGAYGPKDEYKLEPMFGSAPQAQAPRAQAPSAPARTSEIPGAEAYKAYSQNDLPF